MLFYKIPTVRLPRLMLMGSAEIPAHCLHITRTLSETVLYYIISGSIDLESGGQRVLLNSGDIHIFSKGEFQRPLKAGACKYCYIHFFDNFETVDMNSALISEYISASRKYFLRTNLYSGDIPQSDFPNILLPKSFNIKDYPQFKKLDADFAKIRLNKHTVKNEHYNLYYNLSAMTLLYKLYIAYSDFAQNRVPGFNEGAVRKTVEYLENNISNHITGNDVEKRFGYSFDHINRKFKAIIGETIFGYLKKARIERAKLLLYTENTSVTKTAELTGFCDIYHFSKAFKKHTGVTPTEYIRGKGTVEKF